MAIHAVVPTGNRAEVVEDLRRRLGNAERAAEQAETAGDEAAFRAALERVWLRTLQVAHVEARGEQDQCPRCTFGEEGWPATMLVHLDVWSACLEHFTPELARQAAELAARP
jgi:hypothetical protein